jgi:hypothetical protein
MIAVAAATALFSSSNFQEDALLLNKAFAAYPIKSGSIRSFTPAFISDGI